MQFSRSVAILFTLSTISFGPGGKADDTLKVMTFNVWSAEDSSGGRAGIVTAVQAGDADIVGFQEMGSNAGSLVATTLGMQYDSESQIATRFDIVDTSMSHGVRIQLAPGSEVYAFNVHLSHAPYGPYQLNGIPYFGGTIYDPNDPAQIAAVIQDQVNARGGQIDGVLAEMQQAFSSGLPVFLTGDFNEASHLDWTEAAASAGTHVAEVAWPTSKSIADAGYMDSFRRVHTDEVAKPGNTWSPVYGPDYSNQGVLEPQDRIDKVYYRGQSVTPTVSLTIGPDDGFSDIVAAEYPSDHRAVITTFELEGVCTLLGDLDGNCILDAADWKQFRNGQHVDMSGLTPDQAYALGDLNGDFRNNYNDFMLFKQNFEAQNGRGALQQLIAQVPESSSGAYAILACPLIAPRMWRAFRNATRCNERQPSARQRWGLGCRLRRVLRRRAVTIGPATCPGS
ncbi:endonuclease/exonuclease/phosphatase family protein [Aeoliella sp.]|uniref:endonuclease/exonuclease/phosphatase family protein n=1 Tax=Aeoliella sp. TaxID=2795800 RepID=UPI003CCB934C